MPHHVYGAVDIGGTKIAAGLVDADGELLHRVELPTPARGPAAEVLATVLKLVDALAADPRWARVAGIGIGSAGPVDPARGTVSPVNIPGWRDFPLVSHVAAHPAVAERELAVKLLGDASAMAAGEHWRGAARGYDDAMCLVVSTGVGAGLIMDGVLRMGPSGNAGHLGHITVDVEGEDCPCGSRGCVETMASGTSIARWAVQHGWRPGAAVPEPAAAAAALPAASLSAASVSAASVSPASLAVAHSDSAAAHSDNVVVAAQAIASAAAAAAVPASGPAPAPGTAAGGAGAVGSVTAADIAAAARAGDEIALAAFERAGRALAAGIAAAATLADLRVAVVGGGVAKAGPVLFDPLRRHLARYASLPFTRDLEVLPATLGGDAGLIGAAAALANGRASEH